MAPAVSPFYRFCFLFSAKSHGNIAKAQLVARCQAPARQPQPLPVDIRPLAASFVVEPEGALLIGHDAGGTRHQPSRTRSATGDRRSSSRPLPAASREGSSSSRLPSGTAVCCVVAVQAATSGRQEGENKRRQPGRSTTTAAVGGRSRSWVAARASGVAWPSAAGATRRWRL